MGVAWIGMDYGVVFSWLERHPVGDEEDFWWALRVMEGEALAIRNKPKER